jgi:hypothetical protein
MISHLPPSVYIIITDIPSYKNDQERTEKSCTISLIFVGVELKLEVMALG